MCRFEQSPFLLSFAGNVVFCDADSASKAILGLGSAAPPEEAPDGFGIVPVQCKYCQKILLSVWKPLPASIDVWRSSISAYPLCAVQPIPMLCGFIYSRQPATDIAPHRLVVQQHC